jgi:signal transduction histidine kinase
MSGPDWEGSAKAAEEALARVASAIPQGVALVRGGQVVWANRRLLETTGRASLEALVGADLCDLLVDAGHGLPGARQTRPVACRLRRASGEERSVVWRPVWPEITPDTDAWIVEDTTHVRSLERELLDLGRELKALHREVAGLREQSRREAHEREDLLTVVSHELRTPLTVIAGYHRLLLSEDAAVGTLSGAQRRYLEESARACRKLDAFVEKLLAASHEPRGADVLELGTGSLSAAAEEAVRGVAPLAAERDVRLTLSLPPGCRARFDRTALEQVLTNLLSNALRYAPRGGRIEVAARELREAGRRMLELSVSDDGPGVPPADRRRIFDPYVQAGKAAGGGLGLGLAICRRLVEAHGGSISVSDSALGGARFAFTLPEVEGGPEAAAPEVEGGPEAAAPEVEGGPEAGR